jgi:hypothetical protein
MLKAAKLLDGRRSLQAMALPHRDHEILVEQPARGETRRHGMTWKNGDIDIPLFELLETFLPGILPGRTR